MSPGPRAAERGRRWPFLALAALVTLPLLVPLRLPITPAPDSRAFHDAVSRVPRGATVVVSFDFDPGTAPELAPIARTLLRQLFERECRVVTLVLWSGGAGLADRLVREAAAEFPARRDGVDYVNLGYQAGHEAVMVRMGHGFASAFPRDSHGRPAARLPILAHARAWSDVALLVSLSAGYPGAREWVQQVEARFQVPMVAGVSAVTAPDLEPYRQSGQLRGLLAGMTGAAEYEVLRGARGPAARGMDAQSLAHAFVAVCLVAGAVVRRTPPRGEVA